MLRWIIGRGKLAAWFLRESFKGTLGMMPGDDLPLWRKFVVFCLACHESRAIWTSSGGKFPQTLPDAGKRAEFLDGFDHNSRMVIRNAHWHKYAGRFRRDRGEYVVIGPKPRPLSENAAKRLDEARKRYALPASARHEESIFCFHHGLWDAPGEILDHIRGKTFVDLGAYIGDSVLVLMEYDPRRVLSFDISRRAKRLYEQTMKRNHIDAGRREFIAAAVGARPGRREFRDAGDAGTSLAFPGKDECEVVRLEDRLGDRETVGFIKADVEGAGIEALSGAMEIIKRDRPVMSLSIYHTPEEFYHTRRHLEENVENYAYRVVGLSPNPICEIVLFCWPAELGAGRDWWWEDVSGWSLPEHSGAEAIARADDAHPTAGQP